MNEIGVLVVISLIIFETSSGSIILRNPPVLVDLAQKLQDNINAATSNPCDNYFDYICDNTVPHKNIANYDVTDKFYKLFDGEPVDDFEGATQINNFLKSCREADLSQLPSSVEKFSSSRNYWPHLNPNWTESEFDINAAVAELNSFGFDVFFEVELESKNNEIFLEISPEEVSVSKNIERILNYTHLTADQIAEIVDDCNQLKREYKKAVNSIKDDSDMNLEFSALSEEIPQIDWTQIISFLGEGNLTQRVLVKDVNKLKATISLMYNVNPKLIGNYLFYMYVKKGVSYLDFNRPDRHENLCRDFTHYFPYNVYKRVVKDHYNLEKQKLFMDIIKISANYLKNAGYAFEEYTSVENLYESIDQELTEFLDDIDDASNTRYYNLNMSPDDFFYNWLLLKRFSYQKFSKDLENSKYLTDVKKYFPQQSFMVSMLYKYSKVTPVAFNLLAKKFISQVISNSPKTKDILNRSTIGECLKTQLNSRKKDIKWIIENVLETEALFNAFSEFSLKYPEVIKSEEAIFEERELTSRKVLYMIFMEQYCNMPKYRGKTHDVENKKKKLLAQLYNYNTFGSEYSCLLGSPMNPEVKCKDE